MNRKECTPCRKFLSMPRAVTAAIVRQDDVSCLQKSEDWEGVSIVRRHQQVSSPSGVRVEHRFQCIFGIFEAHRTLLIERTVLLY